VVEGRIIRTCSFFAALLAASALLAPAPAAAVVRFDSARTYLEARAAAIGGNHTRSAQLLAEIVDTSAGNATIQREAVSQAISAGDMKLALRLVKNLPPATMPIDAKLLQVADALRSNDSNHALALLQATGEAGDISFLRAFVEAWAAADSRDLSRALSTLDALSARNMLAALVPENRALILLKFGKIADADPYVAQALKVGGGREQRLRLAFADDYLALGDKTRALSMADGLGTESARVRDRIMRGQPSGPRIDNGRRAFSELLVVLSGELERLQNETMPVTLAQIARFTAPENSSATITLGLMLDRHDRPDDAIATFRSVPSSDGLASRARDAEVRTLVGANRKDEAVQVAQRAIGEGMASITDYARLGDAYEAVDKHAEAAAAYGRALQLAGNAKAEDRWPLMVLQASALEEGNHWPEARAILIQALALAPEEPVILNFLGYARLERGEELDAAEAMIRKASALAPDDASITDSLGWALYKRGRLDEAIEVLSRAAKGDPTQAEIREHLGDALYKAGNRFEARYSWSAALATADDEIAKRVKAKLEAGLTPTSAAP
jgi:tetratricopeptide (TPR) repeat protein